MSTALTVALVVLAVSAIAVWLLRQRERSRHRAGPRRRWRYICERFAQRRRDWWAYRRARRQARRTWFSD